MEEREAAARWVRRIGSVAALAILALLLGELSVHEGHSETPRHPASSAQPDKRYGPNPNYRLTPQIDRIIRLAQRNKKEEEKGGTQLKTAPVQKKTAPVTKKQAPAVKKTAPTKKKVAPARKKTTTPTVKKKETAPVKKKIAPIKKKEAPVVKKKEPAPVKEETAPVKKEEPAAKTAPVQTKEPIEYDKAPPAKETAPGAPPSEEQLQENKAFCAQNPDSPKCAPAEAPSEAGPTQEELNEQFCAKNPTSPKCASGKEQPPATEKICAANPNYPGCDKLKQPDLGAPDEESGKVPSLCEQNPQLPQCQTQETTEPEVPGGRPEEEDAVEAPPGPPGEDAPPGFPPPGGPIPPGPPPSPPPPPPSDDSEAVPPSGPQIQTVTECPEGQVLFLNSCVYLSDCPEGQVETGPSEPGLQCGESCPAGMVSIANQCYDESYCFSLGGVSFEGQCLTQCPEETEQANNTCQPTVAECPEGQGRLSDGTCGTCPEGMGIREDGTCGACPAGTAEDPAVGSDGRCLAECPIGTIRDGEQCVPGCPEGQTLFAGSCVNPGSCPEGELQYTDYDQSPPQTACGTECPEGQVVRLGACVGQTACNLEGGTVYNMEQCVEQCPEAALTYNDRCFDQCPEGVGDLGDGTCGRCPDGQEAVNGACLDECPAGTIREGDQCVAGCQEGMTLFAGRCIEPGNCPEGQLAEEQSDGTLECIDRDECLEDDFMVERAGACIGYSICTNGGGVLDDRVCLEECPEGKEKVGNVCQEACPAGTERVGGECVGECPAGQSWQDGQCVAGCPEGLTLFAGQCVNEGSCSGDEVEVTPDQEGVQCADSCPDGQVARAGTCLAPVTCSSQGGFVLDDECVEQCPEGLEGIEGTCLEPCPAGMIHQDSQCVPEPQEPCPSPNEIRVDGVCMSPGELPYDDVMQLCLTLEEAGAVLPEDQQGATPQETCENMIADGCEQGQLGGVPASEAPACTERPCGEGQENVNGQCQCTGGLFTLDDGSCSATCPEGQVGFDGSCTPACAEGEVRRTDGSCAASCGPDVVEYQGQCLAPCPEGQIMYQGQCQQQASCPEGTYEDVASAGEVCVAECAEGQYPVNTSAGPQCRSACPYSHEDINGNCVANCPPGQARGDDGQCSNPCSGGQVFVAGQCRDECEGIASMNPDGTCSVGCRDRDTGVPGGGGTVDDGFCMPVHDATPEHAIERCMDGFFGNWQPPGTPDQAACEAAMTEYCELFATNSSGAIPAYCVGAPPPPADADEAPPPDETPPPDGEAPAPPPPDETAPPPDGEAPPPDGEAPPPDETAPPPDGTLPPPPEDAGEYGSICEQNPQLPQCQDQEPGEGAPPPGDEEAPPANEPPPTDTETPPPDQGAECEPGTTAYEGACVDDSEISDICEPGQVMHGGACQDNCPSGTVHVGNQCVPTDGAPPADETPPLDETAPPPTAPPSSDVTPPPSAPSADGTPPPSPPAEEDAPADEEKPAAPADETAEDESAKPIAVVIAIDDYDNDALEGSPQAISNAAHIVRFLKSDLEMDDGRIITGRNAKLSDFEEIFGKPGDAESELRDVVKKTKSPEVIVYYAGRAKALDGGDDVLLLPSDADPTKPETGVRLSALYSTLHAMGIPKLRVYLDPSFVEGDGVVKLNAAPRIGLFGLFTPKDWIALSAASDDAPLPRDADRPRSLFTESLVAGLRGIADTTAEGNGDGTITAEELYLFTKSQAEAAAKRGETAPVPSLNGSPEEPLRTY